MQQSFHAPDRGVEGELEWEVTSQRLEFGELQQAAADALQRRLDELQVVQAAAHDGHLRVGAEDLERALEEGLEIAEAEAGIGVAEGGVAGHQLHLRRFAENAGHAAVAEKGGEVVGVGSAAQILIIDQIKITIKNMNILSMIITMT